MKAIIDIFRMDEVTPKTRAKIIIRLGVAINETYASNITEPLVFELVSLLDPKNEILQEPDFIKRAKS